MNNIKIIPVFSEEFKKLYFLKKIKAAGVINIFLNNILREIWQNSIGKNVDFRILDIFGEIIGEIFGCFVPRRTDWAGD